MLVDVRHRVDLVLDVPGPKERAMVLGPWLSDLLADEDGIDLPEREDLGWGVRPVPGHSERYEVLLTVIVDDASRVAAERTVLAAVRRAMADAPARARSVRVQERHELGEV